MANQGMTTAGKKKQSASGGLLYFFKGLVRAERGQSWVSVILLLLIFLPVGLVLLHWKLSRRVMDAWSPFLIGGILLFLFYLFGEITQLDLFLAGRCTTAQFAGVSLAGFVCLGVSSFIFILIGYNIRKKNRMIRTYRALIKSGSVLDLGALTEITGRDEKKLMDDLSMLIEANYLTDVTLDREGRRLVPADVEGSSEKKEGRRLVPADIEDPNEKKEEAPEKESAGGEEPLRQDAIRREEASVHELLIEEKPLVAPKEHMIRIAPTPIPAAHSADDPMRRVKPHRRSRPVFLDPARQEETSPAIFLLNERLPAPEGDQVTFDEYIVASPPASSPSVDPLAGETGGEETAPSQPFREGQEETSANMPKEVSLSAREKRALRKMRKQEIARAKEEHRRQMQARIEQKRQSRRQTRRERIAAEKAARQRARERAIREKAAQAQMMQERRTKDQAAQDRLAQEKLLNDRAEAEDVARSRRAREAAAKRSKEKLFPGLSRNALAPDLYPEGSLPADPALAEYDEDLIRSTFKDVYPGEAPIASVTPIRPPKKDREKDRRRPGK